MTDNQASNLISKGRQVLNDFIEVKDGFTALYADFSNLDAAIALTDDHFVGTNAGIDAASFKDAIAKLAAVLQTAEVVAATKPVYKVGRS